MSATRRRGPMRAICATLYDGRISLVCGHKVPPTTSKKTATRMLCPFCPESPRAAYFRLRYEAEGDRRYRRPTTFRVEIIP